MHNYMNESNYLELGRLEISAYIYICNLLAFNLTRLYVDEKKKNAF